MTHVTVLGGGSMGSAIADLVTRGGNSVEVLTSTDVDKPVTGDIVVLAVPYAALADIVSARGASLSGKVVVDLTNPVDFETFDALLVAPDGSAATELAEALPDARVLKAFNTNFASTLASGKVGDLITTVLVAGDDKDAKTRLTTVIQGGGLRVVDAGPLRRAREMESIGYLQLTLAVAEKISWAGGFGVAG